MKYYKVSEFAKIVGKSTSTLREWDKLGLLKPHHRGKGGYRYYSSDQVEEAFAIFNQEESNKIVLYCIEKKNAEIELKIREIISFIDVDKKRFDVEIIKEDRNLRKFKSLINMLIDKKVNRLFIYDGDVLDKNSRYILTCICDELNCEVKFL